MWLILTLLPAGPHFRQQIDYQGRQQELAVSWQPSDYCVPLGARVSVPIEERTVWVGAWLYILRGNLGGEQPVILLDTDLAENSQDDKEITHDLYGDGQDYRLKQEIVLGIGGVRMLHALGIQVRQYHMNEGHSALLTLQLLRQHAYNEDEIRAQGAHYDIPRVRELCNFTTHTPVEAGHDKFPYDLVKNTLGEFINFSVLQNLAGSDCLNMTRLALNLSECVNGVTKLHAETSRKMFPGYRMHAITNGVHPFTWTSQSFRALYNQYIPGWCHEPELLNRVDCTIPEKAIWQAHQQSKHDLMTLVRNHCEVDLDPALPIIGFARRMTAYKRPDLLFSDIERLTSIAKMQPFQILLAGKAHPKDIEGKRLIETLHAHMRTLRDKITIAYVPDYGMAVAASFVAGVDIWLNTPQRPLEASGTSGMKAAFNGVPSLSILDGWWVEGCIEGVTGWAIGNGDDNSENEAEALYKKLEHTVLPLYYQEQDSWIRIMKSVIAKNASFFNSHRMMRRYVTDAYIR